MSSFNDWETELYHHGILGMKWGVRRYQNEDGSWTAAGLKRKAKLERLEIRANAKIERAKNRAKKQQLKAERHKKAKDMTDDELRRGIERLNLEKQYNELKTNTEAMKAGSSVVKSILAYAAQKELNEIKKEELKTRTVEAISRAKQAKQNAKQARQQRLQSVQNRLRDEANKGINRRREVNKKRELKIVKRALKHNPSKYKEYLNGNISIEKLLGIDNNKKDD